ncbi:MAG: hypothetical protein GXP49_18220 [Deltaproteobacteria bacterium]|nr:hypothetical protein [Deltaproteobacteria bacterium]
MFRKLESWLVPILLIGLLSSCSRERVSTKPGFEDTRDALTDRQGDTKDMFESRDETVKREGKEREQNIIETLQDAGDNSDFQEEPGKSEVIDAKDGEFPFDAGRQDEDQVHEITEQIQDREKIERDAGRAETESYMENIDYGNDMHEQGTPDTDFANEQDNEQDNQPNLSTTWMVQTVSGASTISSEHFRCRLVAGAPLQAYLLKSESYSLLLGIDLKQAR